MEAFNAGLVIFSALLLAPRDSNTNPLWAFAEQARPYLNMAIEALHNLDHGNRVIERCVQYLSQLSLVLVRQSELFPGLYFPAWSYILNEQ